MSFAILRTPIRAAAALSLVAAGALLVVETPRAAARAALSPDAPLETLQEAQAYDAPQPNALRWSGDRAVALMEALDRKLDYVPGEVLVKFKDGTTIGGAQQALSSLRSRPGVDELTWVGKVARLHDASTGDSRVLAATLAGQPEVVFAEPNYLYLTPEGEPTDFTSEPGLNQPHAVPTLTPTDPSYGLRQWNFLDIGAERAWGINPGGRNDVIVAVIDSGITDTALPQVFPFWTGSRISDFAIPFAVSPDLAAANFVKAKDFVFFTAGSPVLDTSRHGTHVASTIAEATNNGIGLAGLAYNVKLMPLKVCLSYWDLQIIRSASGIPGFAPRGSGGCPLDGVVEAIRYAADNGARVANMSLGSRSQSEAQREALTYAVSKGMFVSMSMGNSYEDGDPVNYPAQYAAALNGAVSVAATNRSRGRAHYSSTGSHAEIAAPGGSTRDGANGSGLIWQMINRTSDVDETVLITPRFDRYEEVGFQGTSMAAPHVAGLAALMVSQMPTITPAAIEDILRRTAIDIGAAGRDNEFGYGLIQARPAIYGNAGRR